MEVRTMIIDTHTKESIQNSICEYFHLTESGLLELFRSFYYSSIELERAISKYVDDNISEFLDGVYFFHLSRRLNGSDLNSSTNLYELLLSKNIFSDFLSNYGISFKQGDNHLVLYHKGKPIDLSQSFHENVAHLKMRMGYYENDQDYCVNGFALRDRLVHNTTYYNQLGFCPEFIYELAHVMNADTIIWDYRKSSTYYCLEYLLPLDQVIIDGKEYIKSQRGKTEEILTAALLRLYNYWLDPRYSFDHDNLILRLGDSDTMAAQYFVRAEEL